MNIEKYKPISQKLHLKICIARLQEQQERSSWVVNEKGELKLQ